MKLLKNDDDLEEFVDGYEDDELNYFKPNKYPCFAYIYSPSQHTRESLPDEIVFVYEEDIKERVAQLESELDECSTQLVELIDFNKTYEEFEELNGS